MHIQKGSVRVAGSVAYCDLRPWILNTSVKVITVLYYPFPPSSTLWLVIKRAVNFMK